MFEFLKTSFFLSFFSLFFAALMSVSYSNKILQEPSNLSESVRHEGTNGEQLPPCELQINDVKITPGHMLFENAYEGKHFEQKLIIQNCGTHIALVRLTQPSSRTFKFKSFKEGINLCPGMRVVRTVKYTYTRALNILSGYATIYVNDEEQDYKFAVTLSAAVLSIEPQMIDFGRIDAVNYAATRTFRIKNSGSKGTHFAIDLGRNPLEMIVEPMKGNIPAKSSVLVSIEIVGSREGEFTEQFWIKTSPPQRVVVTGTFISPKLLVRKFINSLDFTLIDFKPTYYGTESTQPLLIKNFSSSHSMFSVMAEIKGTTMPLEEAKKIDDNYRNFTVKPIDGRLAALKGAVIQITFSPVRTCKREKNYAACILKVIRMDCRDITNGNEMKDFLRKRTNVVTDDNVSNILSTTKDNYALSDFGGDFANMAYEEEVTTESFSFEHAIGVCVYGEKLRAGVNLQPTVINMNDLTLNRNYQRVLLFTNKSDLLPITVKYRKIPSIDVIPQEFEIKPGGDLEVLITIRTLKLDRDVRKVIFNLLSKDLPEDKNIVRKVGTATLMIEAVTTEVVRQTKFDNCLLCNDLPLKLPPAVFPYRFTESELARKTENDNYYLSYIRSLRKIPPQENEDIQDYPVSYPKFLKCQKPEPLCKKVKSFTSFIPLAPRLLYNIKITPKSIRIRRVAAFTTITDFFEIENLNTFPIRVSVHATKPCIAFSRQSRYVVKSKEKKKIYFTFSSYQTGRYFVNINILVNDSTLYEVTAIANVVPKTLKTECSSIEFAERDGHYKFFKMINWLNAYTSFEWDIPRGCFQIYPKQGGIKAERFILCLVIFAADPSESNVAECTLTSESGQKQVVTISARKRQHSVVFDTYEINAGLIPLNVPVRKKVILRNLRNFQTLYSIPSGVPVPGITIDPTQGILEGLDSQVFIINILLKVVIEFSTQIVFYINEEEQIAINLRGVVEYPQIIFKPDLLYFRKISPYSFDTLAFKVKNVSKCELSVSFPVEDFPEFTITDSEDKQHPHQKKVLLAPQQAKLLFLHFHPNYVSTYSLYLPYIVNDILGPVLINSTTSVNPKHFLRHNMLDYDTILDVRHEKIPRVLPTVRINCSAIEKILEFSSLTINFVYFGEDHYNNFTRTDWEVTNTSKENASVCIRTDNLEYPFFLTLKSETCVEYYSLSLKVVLEPGEKVVFEAEFFPSNLRKDVVKLPIFLQHYYDNKIFNYLTLEGVYLTPSITPSTNRCDFEPVPLRLTNKKNLELRMENHFENCKIETECDVLGLYTTFTPLKDSDKANYVVNVVISCSCDAICSVIVTGVTENCLLTTHASSHLLHYLTSDDGTTKSLPYSENYSMRPRFVADLVNRNITCYPLFPSDDDCSEYGVYMRSLEKTLENWIFSQVFYMKHYYRIPEGFSDFCKVSEARKVLRFGVIAKAKYVEIPLLQLLMNIAGRGVRDQLAPSALPETENEVTWLTYVYTVNSNVLYYLRGFAVFLPHVKAKFLLNYEQYQLYEKIKHPEEQPMAEDYFYRLSKQCWIDLILQIIKAFFLFRSVQLAPIEQLIPLPSQSKFRHRQSISQISRTSIEEGECVLDFGFYGEHEKELIAWLHNCYDAEKSTLWSNQDQPPDKELVFLDEDLRDGLVLGAITAHFCPYVQSEIREMYTRPHNPEEILHNACVLIKTWQMLKFSYVISPLSLLNSGMVEMLLLTNYLYNVLPNCLPKEQITIQAPLTQTNVASIELHNLGKDSIIYQIIFFGNEIKLFTTAIESVRIEAGKKKTVIVRYLAKSVNNAYANLLFSGETPGHKYGKSVAFTLVGVADVSYSCMQIPITVDLYKLCRINIHTQSPFQVKTHYNLYFGYQPASKERNVLFPWEEVRNLKTVKEFVLEDEICEFDEEGKSITTQMMCCQQQGPRNMFLYYTNPEVGDWGIQLTVTGKLTDLCYEKIEIELPENYQSFVCKCKQEISLLKNCPMVIHVKLPMKNNPLWNARKTMVLQYVKGEELQFWSKRIFTPSGTRILKLILDSETHPMRQVIEETVEYTVAINKPNTFVALHKVVVDDVTSEGYFDLPMHPRKNVNVTKLKSCSLKLVSDDGTETRFYRLFFAVSSTSKRGTSVSIK